jgi:hypothetical protein
MKQTLNTILKKLLNKRSKRSTIFGGLILVLMLSALFHQGVFPEALAQVTATAGTDAANSTVAGNALGALGQGLGGAVAALATLFIKLISAILYFILRWMGPLMDNTFILEGDIGLKIRTVWVIIRNFVNIFFALALVGVALMSVVGYGDEGGNYALKKFIPKMALALIAVNFTFLACRIILDVNNVLTTAIFSIPQSITSVGTVGPSGLGGQTIFKRFECLSNKNLTAEINRTEALEKNQLYRGAIASLGGVCFAQDPGSATYEQLTSDAFKNNPTSQAIISLDQSQFTKRDFIWVMATQFQGIHDLNKVSVLLDPTFNGLTINALFSAVFAVVYATAYISMFIILVARVAVLWVTIMLSPLAAITIVFPELKIQEFDIKEQFLKHAFVPAKMALPMALGYIMLSQMSLVVHSSSSIFSANSINLTGGEFARGVSFTTLIYGAASVAVLWMGVFTATKGVVGEGVVTSFSDTIKGIGKTVAKWPTYLPLVPVSGGVSLQNLRYTVDELRDQMSQRQLAKDQEFFDKNFGNYFPSSELRRAIQQVESGANSDNLNMTAMGTILASGNNRQIRDTLTSLLTSDKLSDTNKRRLASDAGYNGDTGRLIRDLQSNRNTAGIVSTLSSSISGNNRDNNGGGGSGGGYANAGRAFTGAASSTVLAIGSGNTTRSIENLNQGVSEQANQINYDQLPEAVRTQLPRGSNGAWSLNNITAEGLAGAIKNSETNMAQRRALVRTNLFSVKASEREDVRQAWAGDTNLLRRLADTVIENPSGDYQTQHNIRVREAFQAIFQKQSNSDLSGLPHGTLISRIKDDGTLEQAP